jgi:hypothetical protein
VPFDRINDDRLYRALDRLLPHKEAIEQHRVQRLGELFDLSYDLLLYDVTSTYFEGLAASNPLAQRGHSRDHRSDCKQVCIALVVTLAWLQETKRRYLIGAPRSELRKWSREIAEAKDWRTVRGGVEAKLCTGPDGQETFLLCRSADRREKERAMHARFAKRIEDHLESLGRRLERSRQRLDREAIGRQIGRLLGKNSRAAGRYAIRIEDDATRASGLRLGVVRSDPAQAMLLDRLGLRLPERLRIPPHVDEM